VPDVNIGTIMESRDATFLEWISYEKYT
jgi:hypothetical protein